VKSWSAFAACSPIRVDIKSLFLRQHWLFIDYLLINKRIEVAVYCRYRIKLKRLLLVDLIKTRLQIFWVNKGLVRGYNDALDSQSSAIIHQYELSIRCDADIDIVLIHGCRVYCRPVWADVVTAVMTTRLGLTTLDDDICLLPKWMTSSIRHQYASRRTPVDLVDTTTKKDERNG